MTKHRRQNHPLPDARKIKIMKKQRAARDTEREHWHHPDPHNPELANGYPPRNITGP